MHSRYVLHKQFYSVTTGKYQYKGNVSGHVQHVYVMHQQDRLLLSQLCLTFPSSMDGARSQNRSKLPRPFELDNRTPPAMLDRAQFGA